MPIYECFHCNYQTKYKSDFSKHLKTKKHRVNTEMNPENPKDLMGLNQNEPKMNQNEPVNLQKDVKKYPCDYCHESFNTIPSKRRHELHRCKKNGNISSSLLKKQERQIKKLEKQIELLLTKVGNNYTTINNTNTNTNNIQLNNYGSEDLSHITDALKTYLIKHPFGAIQQLIEKIHFNRDKPENINLMITNKRDNKISVYEDGKWVYRNKKKTIQRLIDNKYYILDDHYNDIDKKELSEFNHTNYKSFSGKMDDNDKQLLEQLYEDAEIIILNKQEKSE